MISVLLSVSILEPVRSGEVGESKNTECQMPDTRSDHEVLTSAINIKTKMVQLCSINVIADNAGL